MNDKSRVLSRLSEDCRQAFLNGSPIIYILSDEISLIDALLDQDVVTPLYFRLPDQSIVFGREYKRELRKIYDAVRDLWNRDFLSFEELYETCGVPTDRLKRYLDRIVEKNDTGVSRKTLLEGYETGVLLPEDKRTNCYYYVKTPSGPLTKFVEEAKISPVIQIVWNFEPTHSALQYLSEYVVSYEKSPANSVYRNSTLLLCSGEYRLPEDMQGYVAVIEVEMPGDMEISEIIQDEITACGGVSVASREYLNALVTALKGYNETGIRKLLRGIMMRYGNDISKSNALQDIRNDKKRLLHKYEVLELEEADEDTVRVGGQEVLLNWMRRQEDCLKNPRERYDVWGLSAAKGVLVCGIPGTGKSLAARQASLESELDLPLLKMDMSTLMNRNLGGSEENMRKALRLAQAMAPCILWIEELEKGFAGAGGTSRGDSGTFKRMFGTFLTWMQDNKAPVFLYATSNDVSELPQELLRNGRFDALFGTMMPTRCECMDIFKKTLTGMHNRVERAICSGVDVAPLFEMEALSDKALGQYVNLSIEKGRRKFMTGADIYVLANTALRIIKEQTGERKNSIGMLQMKRAIDLAYDEVRTYGEGRSNLIHIAKTYVRLLENKFLPASATPLLTLEEIRESLKKDGDRRLTVRADGYDGLLKEVILEHMDSGM